MTAKGSCSERCTKNGCKTCPDNTTRKSYRSWLDDGLCIHWQPPRSASGQYCSAFCFKDRWCFHFHTVDPFKKIEITSGIWETCFVLPKWIGIKVHWHCDETRCWESSYTLGKAYGRESSLMFLRLSVSLERDGSFHSAKHMDWRSIIGMGRQDMLISKLLKKNTSASEWFWQPLHQKIGGTSMNQACLPLHHLTMGLPQNRWPARRRKNIASQ